MSSPQQRLATVKRSVAQWWAQPYQLVTTASLLGRYPAGSTDTLLAIVNSNLQALDDFKRGLTMGDWSGISLGSTVGEVFVLSKKCF